jgi:hypothetical protein
METRAPRDLPRWLWLATPFVILVIQVLVRLGGDEAYRTWMRGEISVPELGTVLWLVVASVGGASLLLDRRHARPNWLTVWISLFTLGCVFFAGEEASWGQHYFHWSTPEALAAANDQRETNIHNLAGIGALFDQLPRTLLTLGAIGALVIAALARLEPGAFGPSNRWYWLWPTYVCFPAALLALVIGIPRKLFRDSLPEVLDLQPGEFKEYFLGMFLALYVWSIVVRRSRLTVSEASQG